MWKCPLKIDTTCERLTIINLLLEVNAFQNQVLNNTAHHDKRNQLTLLIIGDDGQKLWGAAIDLYMILNFEGV